MLVKEALVEILAEGLTSTVQTINENTQRSRQLPRQQNLVSNNQSVKDKINFLPRESQQVQQQRTNPALDRRVVSSLTSDPILQEMLSDTAARGTPIIDESHVKQNNHEIMVASSGDVASKAMLRSDPTDMFGEASSKWAMLAFSEKRVGT